MYSPIDIDLKTKDQGLGMEGLAKSPIVEYCIAWVTESPRRYISAYAEKAATPCSSFCRRDPPMNLLLDVPQWRGGMTYSYFVVRSMMKLSICESEGRRGSYAYVLRIYGDSLVTVDIASIKYCWPWTQLRRTHSCSANKNEFHFCRPQKCVYVMLAFLFPLGTQITKTWT